MTRYPASLFVSIAGQPDAVKQQWLDDHRVHILRFAAEWTAWIRNGTRR